MNKFADLQQTFGFFVFPINNYRFTATRHKTNATILPESTLCKVSSLGQKSPTFF